MVVTKRIVSSKPVFLSQLSPRGRKGSHSWDASMKSDHVGTTGRAGVGAPGSPGFWLTFPVPSGRLAEGHPRGHFPSSCLRIFNTLLSQRMQPRAAGARVPLSIGQPGRSASCSTRVWSTWRKVQSDRQWLHACWAHLELPVGGGEVTGQTHALTRLVCSAPLPPGRC